MEVILELICEIFGELIIAALSRVFDNISYSKNSKKKLKVVFSILYFALAIGILIYAAVVQTKVLLLATIIFIIVSVIVHLAKFINNNYIHKRFINTMLYALKDIARYAYYFTIFILADTLGGKTTTIMYFICTFALFINFMIDMYKLTILIENKNGIRKKEKNTLNNDLEKDEKEELEIAEDDKTSYVIYEQTSRDNLFASLSIGLWIFILFIIIFSILTIVFAIGGIYIEGYNKTKSILIFVLAGFTFSFIWGFVAFVSSIAYLKQRHESVSYENGFIVHKKVFVLDVTYIEKIKKSDCVALKGNGIYNLVGRSCLVIKGKNPIIDYPLSQCTKKKYKETVLSGISKQKKQEIIEKLNIDLM